MMKQASVTYQGRTYHAFGGTGRVHYAEGPDIKRAMSVRDAAVPPVVRAELLTVITGQKHVPVKNNG